jgi:hypothetical protein
MWDDDDDNITELSVQDDGSTALVAKSIVLIEPRSFVATFIPTRDSVGTTLDALHFLFRLIPAEWELIRTIVSQ